jgi:hypothetical protein
MRMAQQRSITTALQHTTLPATAQCALLNQKTSMHTLLRDLLAHKLAGRSAVELAAEHSIARVARGSSKFVITVVVCVGVVCTLSNERQRTAMSAAEACCVLMIVVVVGHVALP